MAATESRVWLATEADVSIDLAGFGSIADLLKSAVTRIWPDKSEAQKLAAEIDKAHEDGRLEELKLAWENAKAQIEVNKIEAASADPFTSRWRPFVGWVGGFGLAYAAIIDPLARFVAKVVFNYAGAFPVIDTTITMQVLFGLLGLGAMRSIERVKGVTK